MESSTKETFGPLENLEENLKIKNSIINYIDTNLTFKCSKDSSLFKSFISKSIQAINKDKLILLDVNTNPDYYAKNNIYSSLMPTDFEIDMMHLPYEEIPQAEIRGIYYYIKIFLLNLYSKNERIRND